MKHTQGPWFINGRWVIQAPTIGPDKNLPRIVAQVIKGHYITDEERRANAQLLVKAPELAEVLQMALDDVDGSWYARARNLLQEISR